MQKIYLILILLLVLEIIVATICGPYSCEWGNPTYAISGIVIVVSSFMLPILHKPWSPGKKLGYALLFLLAALLVWLIGFLVFDFRMMCRMF